MEDLEYLEKTLALESYILSETSQNLSKAEDALRRDPNNVEKAKKVKDIKKDYDRMKNRVDGLNMKINSIVNSLY